MSITYIPNNEGGLFSQLFPKIMEMAGTAIGGPVGGQIGQMGGNLIMGHPAQAAGGAISLINGLPRPSAGKPIPSDDEIYQKYKRFDKYFGGEDAWRSL